MLELVKKYSSDIVIGLLFTYFSFGYLSYAYANISLVILSVVFIYSLFLKKEKPLAFTHFKDYLLLLIPYILTLLSVVLSHSFELGFSHLFHKLPIVIVPFIILSVLSKKEQIKRVAGIYIFFSLIGFIITFYKLFEINPNIFKLSSEFSKQATIIQHPYFGVYQLLAIVFLVEFYKDSLNKILFYGFLVLFSLGVLISTSRISYILYFLVAFLYVSKLFSRRNAIIFLIIITGFFSILVSSNDSLQHKFSRSFVYATSPRLLLWKNSFLVLKNTEKPLLGASLDYFNEGVKDPYWLLGYVKDLGEDYQGLKGYSSHNQYLEFILLNGILGLAYLLLMLYGLIVSLKSRDVFLISLLIIIGIFSFTESILHRQYGIILYVLLMPIVLKLGKN